MNVLLWQTSTKKKSFKGNKGTVKSTSEESSKTSSKPKKQKAAGNEKDIKTENDIKSPGRKSVIPISEDKCDSAQLNEEEREKQLKKKNGKLSNTRSAIKAPKRKDGVDVDDLSGASDKRKNKNKDKRPLRKRKKVDYSLGDSDNGSEADEEWKDQSSDSDDESEDITKTKENSKIKGKTPLARRKVSAGSDSGSPNGNSSLSFVDLMDDDSDFEVTSKPLVKRRVSASSSGGKKKTIKMVSSDESDDSVKCLGTVSNEQGLC